DAGKYSFDSGHETARNTPRVRRETIRVTPQGIPSTCARGTGEIPRRVSQPNRVSFVKSLKVCISIIGNYRYAFPTVYYPRIPSVSFAILNNLSFNFANVASSVCLVTTNYYGHLLLMTLGPLGALAAGAAYTYILHRDGFDVYCTYALWGSYLVYTSSATTILRTFNCDSDFDTNRERNTVSFLRSDYSVSCNTQTHTIYVIYAWVMVFLIIVGCPAAYFFALFHVRRDLNPKNLKEAEEFVERHHSENQNAARRISDSLVNADESSGDDLNYVVVPIDEEPTQAQGKMLSDTTVESARDGLRRRNSAPIATELNSSPETSPPPDDAADMEAAIRAHFFHLSITILTTARELEGARLQLATLLFKKDEMVHELSRYPEMSRRFLSLFVVGNLLLQGTDNPKLIEWLDNMDSKIVALQQTINQLEATFETQEDAFAVAARENMAIVNPDREARLRSLSFLYVAYESRCWYWEVVRRNFFSVRRILVFTNEDRVSSLYTPVFIALAFLALYGYYRPYVDEKMDNFSTKAQLVAGGVDGGELDLIV
ncbi:hypothetical protein CTAYLR_004684, partial [Chrysophaeum taylorii]